MARTKHYPPDATIADVLPDLADDEDYLRQVLVTMRMCQKHYGDAWVRIGVTGRSPTPSYRIDRPDETARGDGTVEAGKTLFGAYGGRSHDRFTQVNAVKTRWSSRALGMTETLALHDGLRRHRGDVA
ncbi:hypothetical protein [Methylobacterium sp.]|uniref:hypothetical protein n=1 Tax=Methylobacterium sp. TaxID=409 RepID=UPI000FB5733C|nr:hypothetical protein [Methylobacterium sp.]RUP22646.1 MAG: hypothetical protein EKK44_04040 [Methylobacterium sp.]